MKETVEKIQEFVSSHQDQSRENFEQFFDEAGFDLFYFGIYSVETKEGRKVNDEDREVVFLPHQEAFNHRETKSEGFLSWFKGFLSSRFVLFCLSVYFGIC